MYKNQFIASLLFIAIILSCGKNEPEVKPVAPSINSFTADPGLITPGQSATLSWDVSSADAISIDNGVGVVTGTSKTISPTSTTTYILTASNSVGQGTAQITVTVSANTTPITVTASGSARTTPLIGFNAPAHHTIANWTQQDFRDSAASMNIGVLRHPGGTNSNYWDWQTGWTQTGAWVPPSFANINPKGKNRYEEGKLGFDACQAKPLLVLNFQWSTIAYQLQGLKHAESLGVPIQYIEMGNEHNLPKSGDTDQFISPGKYGKYAAIWADTLKKHYPNSKICFVGGDTPARQDWIDSILLYNPKFDALSMHIYLGAGNNDGVFDATRALSIPFSNAGVVYRYNMGHFTTKTNKEVWVTEFNLSEKLAGSSLQHGETWTHALYVSAMAHLLLSQPQVTMLINHAITNQSEFAAIDANTHKITANGAAMMLLGEASKGLDNMTALNFASQPNVTYQSTTYPSLIGWKFSKGNVEKVWIVNMSDDPLLVSTSTIISGIKKFKFYSAAVNFKVNGIKSIMLYSGTTSDQISVPAYSIGILEK